METEPSFMEIQGIKTAVFDSREGPSTVILLHGGGIDCASLSWGLFYPELVVAHRVVAFDWPGYGESAPLPGACSTDSLVDFLTALLDELRIQRASLVGVSMGGAAALGFALAYPERVEKLVLVDSYGLMRRTPMHALGYLFIKIPGMNQLSWAAMRSRSMLRWSLQSFLRRPGSLTGDLVEMALEEVLRPRAGQAWISFQNSEMTWAGTRTCYLDRLDEINTPTLILHGTLDTAAPPEGSREAHVLIRKSRLYWMEGCGHWPQRDHPAEFNRVVKGFLAEA
jgi:pimeloyl-ACP methyl ester carboxylesterase